MEQFRFFIEFVERTTEKKLLILALLISLILLGVVLLRD